MTVTFPDFGHVGPNELVALSAVAASSHLSGHLKAGRHTILLCWVSALLNEARHSNGWMPILFGFAWDSRLSRSSQLPSQFTGW